MVDPAFVAVFRRRRRTEAADTSWGDLTPAGSRPPRSPPGLSAAAAARAGGEVVEGVLARLPVGIVPAPVALEAQGGVGHALAPRSVEVLARVADHAEADV